MPTTKHRSHHRHKCAACWRLRIGTRPRGVLGKLKAVGKTTPTPCSKIQRIRLFPAKNVNVDVLLSQHRLVALQPRMHHRTMGAVRVNHHQTRTLKWRATPSVACHQLDEPVTFVTNFVRSESRRCCSRFFIERPNSRPQYTHE